MRLPVIVIGIIVAIAYYFSGHEHTTQRWGFTRKAKLKKAQAYNVILGLNQWNRLIYYMTHLCDGQGGGCPLRLSFRFDLNPQFRGLTKGEYFKVISWVPLVKHSLFEKKKNDLLDNTDSLRGRHSGIWILRFHVFIVSLLIIFALSAHRYSYSSFCYLVATFYFPVQASNGLWLYKRKWEVENPRWVWS